jgi:hypothetical protein
MTDCASERTGLFVYWADDSLNAPKLQIVRSPENKEIHPTGRVVKFRIFYDQLRAAEEL